MTSTNICEKHGLSQLLHHVLSPDYQLKKGYIEACPNYAPLRSGYDLAPHGQSGIYVEGPSKVWRDVEEREVEQVIEDVIVRGYNENAGVAGSELLDTRMLGEETAKRAVSQPATVPKKKNTSSASGVKIKLKLKS